MAHYSRGIVESARKKSEESTIGDLLLSHLGEIGQKHTTVVEYCGRIGKIGRIVKSESCLQSVQVFLITEL